MALFAKREGNEVLSEICKAAPLNPRRMLQPALAAGHSTIPWVVKRNGASRLVPFDSCRCLVRWLSRLNPGS